MFAYTFRRLPIGLLTLLLISFVIYGLIRAMPGDPAAFLELNAQNVGVQLSDDQFREMQRHFGLEKHWMLAYLDWLGKTLSGDLGISLRWRLPVRDMILTALGPTLLLSVTSLALAYLLSVPLGLYASYRSGRPDERLLSTLLYVLYSFPSYVVAIFLLLIFGVELGVLPVSGMRSQGYEELSTVGRLGDLFMHMILPVTCYTYGSLAYYTRFIRSNLAEVVRQDYVRTARAKGLTEGVILVKHAFRNALVPFVTLIGLSLPALLSGSVILERIFAWPGMGRLFFEAIDGRDYPLIMGLTMAFSVVILLGTLLADLLYALVDPRITYS